MPRSSFEGRAFKPHIITEIAVQYSKNLCLKMYKYLHILVLA